jgi:hypothetical protein
LITWFHVNVKPWPQPLYLCEKGHYKKAQIIGDCEILTKAMNGSTEVSNLDLSKILGKIRLEAKSFKEITFLYVSGKYNKWVDALATTASILAEAGKQAICDKDWDPRENSEDLQDRLEMVQSSTGYRHLRGKNRFDAAFPITTSSRPTSFNKRNVQEDWRSFPSHMSSKGTRMGKVRTGCNLIMQAIINPKPPVIQGYK